MGMPDTICMQNTALLLNALSDREGYEPLLELASLHLQVLPPWRPSLSLTLCAGIGKDGWWRGEGGEQSRKRLSSSSRDRRSWMRRTSSLLRLSLSSSTHMPKAKGEQQEEERRRREEEERGAEAHARTQEGCSFVSRHVAGRAAS
eukprot:44637-Hanusia_phi.AAC.2